MATQLKSYGYENQYNEYYNEDEYYEEQQQPSLYNEQNVDFSRRDTTGAFFRGLTAAGAVAAGSAVMRPWNANAAEFSSGGVASNPAPPTVAPVGSPPPPAQAAAVLSKTKPSFPKFTQLRTPARTSTGSPVQYKNSLAQLYENGMGNVLAAGAVATAGFVGVAGTLSSQGDKNWADDDKPAPAASVPKAPEKPKKEEKPWYQPPTPYGIVNKGENPFANKGA